MRATLIPTHVSNRDTSKRSRTHLPLKVGGRRRRAFSLPEVAAAMAVLMIISSIISLAVARSLTSQGVVKDVRAVSTQLSSLLNQASTSDYASLVEGTFARPQACADDPSASCITLGSNNLKVVWEVALGEDAAGNSLQASNSVTLSAKTVLPLAAEAREIERSREVAAPNAGWNAGQGLVRVQNAGSSYANGVFLLTSEETPRVVASHLFEGESNVLLRAEPSDCSADAPCFLALDEKGSLLTKDSTLSIADVEAGGNQVVLTSDAITDAVVHIQPRSTLEVSLEAKPDAGAEKGSPEMGSICLWANITSGRTVLEAPLCNLAQSDKVSLNTFDLAGKEIGIPVGSSLGLMVDSASQGCPMHAGMRSFSAGAWVDGASCTSWTWGTPESLKVGEDLKPFEGARISMDDSLISVSAIWSGDKARPAAGYGEQSTWSKPRDMNTCALDGTCVSTPTPEAEACPGAHCFSSANFLPQITTPLDGSVDSPAIVSATGSNAFTLSFRDFDDEPFNVVLETAPSQGVLNGVEGPLGDGALLGDFVALGDVALDFVAPSNGLPASFTLRLSDSRGSYPVTIKLAAADQPYLLASSGLEITQGEEEASLNAVFKDLSGAPVADASVSVSGLPDGLTLDSTSTTTNSEGKVSLKLNATKAPAGEFKITLSSLGVNTDVTLEVKPSLGSLAGTYNQGKLTLLALDEVGAPMGGQIVSSVFTSGGQPVRGVYTNWASCTTSITGECFLDVVFEDGAQVSGLNAEFKTGDLKSSTIIVNGG